MYRRCLRRYSKDTRANFRPSGGDPADLVKLCGSNVTSYEAQDGWPADRCVGLDERDFVVVATIPRDPYRWELLEAAVRASVLDLRHSHHVQRLLSEIERR